VAPDSTNKERGSALLIVFLFAAIVAIMLYKQMPDAVFEGERQKEQVLIDRGHEYKIGIKRFLARNQRYPTSLDQLDNFNGQLYIRRRYKDPITGKDEWRLIHVMTPGFILTDSKVTPLKNNNLNGNQPNNGQSGTGGFAQTNSSGFGNSFGNSNNNQNNPTAQNSSGFGQSGFGQSGFGQSGFGSFDSNDDDSKPDPNAPPEPTAAQIYGAKRRPPATPNESMPGDQNDDSDPSNNEALPLPVPAEGPDQQTADAANGNPQQAQQPGQPGANNNADSNNPAAAALNAVNRSMRQQGPAPTSQNNSFGSSTFGKLNSGGGIAGVATKAKGATIKTVDGQTDLSKWEFVYNPQKDALAGMQGAQNRMSQNANGPNSNNSSSGFGNSSSGFGSNSFGSNSSGFGSKSTSGFGSSSSGFGSNSNSSGFGSSSSGFGSSSSGFGSNSSGFGSSTSSRPPSR
jgi:hypothetical protein